MRLSVTAFRSIRRLVLAAACAALAPAAAAQDLVRSETLTLEDGRRLAAQAAIAGDFLLARQLAEALLDADPRDRDALVILAAVLPRLGEATLGRQAGVAAYRYSATDRDRYEAARLTARAAFDEGRPGLAQLWLRRAALVAPDAAARDQTRADYAQVRARNPWQSAVKLGFGPSDNLNGGSESALNVIDGLPFVGVLSGDAQALSGWEATADLRLSYALAASATGRTVLGARLYLRRVALSDAARETAPEAENADFGSTAVEIDLARDWIWGEGQGTIEATLGRTWFGGEADTDFARLSLSRAAPLGERLSYRAGLTVERQWDAATGTPGNDIATLDGALTYKLASGARLTGSLALTGITSDSPNERSDAARAQLGWTAAEPIGPIALSASLGVGWAHYPDYTVIFPVPGGREDRQVYGSLSATLLSVDYGGFSPVFTLSATDTDSNVSRFERSELGLSVSLRSTF